MRETDSTRFHQRVDRLEKIINSGQEIPSDIFPINTHHLVLPLTIEFRNPTYKAAEIAVGAWNISVGGSILMGSVLSLASSVAGIGN